MIHRGVIRDAVSADAAAIARIRVDSWRATYAGIVPDAILERMDATTFAEWLGSHLDARDHGVLVAQAGHGAIEGFVIAGAARDDDAQGLGEIQAIYVDPEAAGHGVGGLLLEAACAALATRGFGSIVLWVLTANGHARRFYERHGFVRDGGERMLDFDGTPVEELRYRRAGPRA